MGHFFTSLRYFFLCSGVFILVLLALILSIPKIELHLLMNSYHSTLADLFFKYGTHMGDGAFAVLFLPLFIFRTPVRTFLFAMMSCTFAGIFAQTLKRSVFPEALRPSAVIDHQLLHLLDGVKMATVHSFPSGHSATAFAFFGVMAFIFRKNPGLQIFFALCAIFTAFSRVYLSQHFAGDILAGCLVGLFSLMLAYLISLKIKTPPLTLSQIIKNKGL